MDPRYAYLSGREFEVAFGICRWQSDDYMGYDLAMDRVRESQPWLPSSPTTELAKRLHKSVWLQLNRRFRGGVGENAVGVYTAIGSPLDLFHKADGFVVARLVTDESAWLRELVVTFDLTTNPSKIQCHNTANLILRPCHFESQPFGCYAGLMVVDKFLERITRYRLASRHI